MNLRPRFTRRNPFSLTATNNSNAIVYPREKLTTRMTTRYPTRVHTLYVVNVVKDTFVPIFGEYPRAAGGNRLKTVHVW